MKHRGKHKLINFYINLLNLLNRFDGSIGTSMRKDAHPSGGVGSSNPCRWRGERLHHHGDGVGELCFLCGFYSTKVGRRKWREPYFEFLRIDGTTPPKKIIREI